MARLTPEEPEKVMVITQVNPFVTALSVPFWRFGMVKVGGRGTLVKMSNGGVAVFSPVALTPEVKEAVAKLGEVKYITAPDMEHHIFLDSWHKAYPTAKVLGPDGLPEKRTKEKKEEVPFFKVFKSRGGQTVDPEFDAEFDTEFVPAHMNKELVFLHKPSKTMIEADYFFNLPATEQFSKAGESAETGFATKLFTALNNTQGEAIWQKRFLWYAISSGDRKGFNWSANRISKWDFDTVVPCHGDIMTGNGKTIFEKVFGWHLAAARREDTKTD